MSAVKDIEGLRFGRLVVASRLPSKNGRAVWSCECDCGGSVSVLGKDLRSGNTQSCGCLLRTARLVAGRANARHGKAKDKGKTYRVWCGMRDRCNNPLHKSWRYYGGRGIKVCERWNSFGNFLADMGEAPIGLTIERIDTNGNYEPTNCRWATVVEQARNRRSVVRIFAFGESKLACEWAEDFRCAVPLTALEKRISAGWHPERAISAPRRRYREPRAC